MILSQEVAVKRVATDKYKRAVANVKLGRNSVNKAMKERNPQTGEDLILGSRRVVVFRC